MKSLTQKLLLVLGIAGLALAYQNCGSQHLSPDDLATANEAIQNQNQGTALEPVAQLGEANAKLQLGDMVMRSMSSLTGVPYTTGAVVTEYNLRAPSMAGSFDPISISSPLQIAVTNLASVYCNQVITSELPMAAASRRLFLNANLGAAFTAESYEAMVRNLAQKLWGRDISAAELAIFQERFTAFNAGFAAATSQANRGRYTALYACTAMLAVFDSLTF